MEHGLVKTYTYRKCRCESCVAANSDYNKKRRARVKREPVKNHGTWESYQIKGCRCALCMVVSGWRYGLERGALEVLLSTQGGCCAVCKTPGGLSDLFVDHDHQCCPAKKSIKCGNCVRGLLCRKCNTALGKFREDPGILRSAIQYLTR